MKWPFGKKQKDEKAPSTAERAANAALGGGAVAGTYYAAPKFKNVGLKLLGKAYYKANENPILRASEEQLSALADKLGVSDIPRHLSDYVKERASFIGKGMRPEVLMSTFDVPPRLINEAVEKGLIVGPRLYSPMAHEMGHASTPTGISKLFGRDSWLERKFSGAGQRMDKLTKKYPNLKYIKPLGLTAVGAAAGKSDSAIGAGGKGALAGAGAGLLLQGPRIYEEARATMKGLKALKQLGVDKAIRRASRGALSRAFGTYLWNAGAPAALLGLGGGLGRHFLTKSLNKKKSEKTATMTYDAMVKRADLGAITNRLRNIAPAVKQFGSKLGKKLSKKYIKGYAEQFFAPQPAAEETTR